MSLLSRRWTLLFSFIGFLDISTSWLIIFFLDLGWKMRIPIVRAKPIHYLCYKRFCNSFTEMIKCQTRVFAFAACYPELETQTYWWYNPCLNWVEYQLCRHLKSYVSFLCGDFKFSCAPVTTTEQIISNPCKSQFRSSLSLFVYFRVC